MAKYTGALDYVYDFQTLITGVAALVAAIIATRYSRRQMKLSARELLMSRGKSVAARRGETSALMQEIRDMQRHLRPWEDQVVEPNVHWAHGSEQRVDTIVSTLSEHLDTSLDGKKIDGARKALIKSSEALALCLFHIHAVASYDFGGFEEPPLSAKPSYQAKADVSVTQVGDRLAEVLKGASMLDEAFDKRLGEIRRELRGLEKIAFKGW